MEGAATRENTSELSAIERLPRAVFASIADYVPEALPQLRLASSTMKHLADLYIGQLQDLVHKIEIDGSQNDEKLLISLYVLPRRADLFELRLRPTSYYRCTPELRARISRDEPNGISTVLVYRMSFDLTEDPFLLVRLRLMAIDAYGKVDTVSLIDCMEDHHVPLIHNLLGGIFMFNKIGTLMMKSRTTTESIAKNLDTLVAMLHADDLRLTVAETSFEPVQFLLSLAPYLNTLVIIQLPVDGVDSNARFFLGHHDFDWAPTIVRMLRTVGPQNSLDKLCIDNSAFPNYLSPMSAQALALELPEVGKNVWFEATSVDNEVTSAKTNGHYVKAGARFLSIKHASRANEPLDDLERLRRRSIIMEP